MFLINIPNEAEQKYAVVFLQIFPDIYGINPSYIKNQKTVTLYEEHKTLLILSIDF